MKKLSVLAIVAALLTGACGTIEYSDVNVIDPTNTLYVTIETPPGAADSGDPLWSTSCSNPAASIDEITDVAGFLTEVMAVAYEEDFGVVHLCAGTYETDDIIEFPNLGSITIEGDGVNETTISGADGDDHALLAMVPADCLPADEPCPSYFNVLTLKDLTMTNGSGGGEVFEIDVDGDDLNDGLYDDDGIPVTAGGAVTAPLVATERVRFSNNSAFCGGAISLYGWTSFFLTDDSIDGDAESEEEALEYWNSLITVRGSQISDTEFIENHALIGGAIAGVAFDLYVEFVADEEIVAYCLNTGPLNIVDSTFERNTAELDQNLEILYGGGAIATAHLLTLLTDPDADEAIADLLFAPWLTITGSTFAENQSQNAGGAVAVIGKVSISSSTFIGNSAPSGGAIALNDYLGEVHVLTRNTFTRNVATDQGGAIAGEFTSVSARGNRFTSNRAPVGSAVAVLTETCSRTWSRQAARDWRGNTFRSNRGGRLPVECFFVAPAPG